MVRRRKLTVVALLVAVIAGLGVAAVYFNDGGNNTNQAPKQTQRAQVQEGDTVPSVAPATVAYEGAVGKSALDLLIQVATVETKESAYGTLVDSINGVKNGTDGKYWLFYVDGQMASVGADAFVSEGGENIEWRFE